MGEGKPSPPSPSKSNLNCEVYYGLKLENTNVSFLHQLAAFPKHLMWTESCEHKVESGSFQGADTIVTQ